MSQQAVSPVRPADARSDWLERFDATRAARIVDPSWLEALRRRAIAHFADVGLPTTRDEDWKYTSVAAIARESFDLAGGPLPASMPDLGLSGVLLDPDWTQLVFVNGRFAPALSSFHDERLIVGGLAEALAHEPLLERELGRGVPFATNGFVALNTALFRDGAFVSVPAGAVIERPIHLAFFTAPGARPIASFPRCLILLGPGSATTVVESYAGMAEERYLSNAVTEIVLGEGATLAHSKIVQEGQRAFHIGFTSVRQGGQSTYASLSVAAGAELARNDLRVMLTAEGADCTLHGLYVASGSQHVDNHTAIDHAQPRGTSRQLYKGVLQGRARAVFNGKIFVRPGAQRTDAHQINRNLVLSPEATVDTKPQLEILADDVKCTHGATVGQLDAEMVFYLKSRGLGDEAARSLLSYGFASEVIDRAAVERVRAHLYDLLARALGADPRVSVGP